MKCRPLREVFRIDFGDAVSRKNVRRKIDPAGAGILDDVAGDIGQLERKSEVAGAIKRRLVPDAHDHRHHHPDNAGDVVAVIQRVRDRRVVTAGDIHLEARQQFLRMPRRNPVTLDDSPKRLENRILDRSAAKREVGLTTQEIEALPLSVAKVLPLRVAHGLPIHHIVAMAAPGIEHDGILAGLPVEQPRGGRKALRAARNRILAGGKDRVAHRPASSIISPAVAFAEPTTPGIPAPGWVPAPTM